MRVVCQCSDVTIDSTVFLCGQYANIRKFFSFQCTSLPSSNWLAQMVFQRRGLFVAEVINRYEGALIHIQLAFVCLLRHLWQTWAAGDF